MTRTGLVWLNAAWFALAVMALGGTADRAIAETPAPSWSTNPSAKLKQRQPPVEPAPAEPASVDPVPTAPAEEKQPLDLPPELIEASPVLQRWLHEIPNVQHDIRHDPAFRTRLRAGYAEVAGDDGFYVGVEDVFVGRTGLTLSAEYQGTGERELYGSELRYYVLPLGSVVNIAPVVGYRRLNLNNDDFSGLQAGLRGVLALSRTGAADLSLTQSWVAPGSDDEAGLTTLSVGYALSDRLRLSTDIQAQNSPQSHDTRFSIGLEWML